MNKFSNEKLAEMMGYDAAEVEGHAQALLDRYRALLAEVTANKERLAGTDPEDIPAASMLYATDMAIDVLPALIDVIERSSGFRAIISMNADAKEYDEQMTLERAVSYEWMADEIMTLMIGLSVSFDEDGNIERKANRDRVLAGLALILYATSVAAFDTGAVVGLGASADNVMDVLIESMKGAGAIEVIGLAPGVSFTNEGPARRRRGKKPPVS